jgi:hypothetical protein
MENELNDSGAIRERVALHLELAKEAGKGRFERLHCPDCRENAVSVWFTNPAPDEYRVWFLGSRCEFHSRAQVNGRPSNYEESRQRLDLEERDRQVIESAVFAACAES